MDDIRVEDERDIHGAGLGVGRLSWLRIVVRSLRGFCAALNEGVDCVSVPDLQDADQRLGLMLDDDLRSVMERYTTA